jgi:hypothetical protein
MPKKAKTKKQKIQADINRKSNLSVSRQADRTVYSAPSEAIEEPISASPEKISYTFQSSKSKAIAIEYPRLINDIRKTILLTFAIATIQIITKLMLTI